jgi:oligopeptide/dipeptide ABC transporter ATP-binding protein
MARIRGRDMAMIFQDPMASLNPVRSVGDQIADKLVRHDGCNRKQALREAVRLLDCVRIPGANQRLRDYPHQLSGGMCQRVMIAMALACRPKLLIADEPTTALDVSTQAQILELLRDIQRELSMAVVLVTHDLGVVAKAADTVAVMYAGRVLETAPTETFFENPLHPYSRGLLASALTLEAPVERLPELPGSVPSLSILRPGCPFEGRCARPLPKCNRERPVLTPCSRGQSVACFNSLEGIP